MLSFINTLILFYKNNRGKIFKFFLLFVILFIFLFSEYGFIKRIELMINKRKLSSVIKKQNQLKDSLNNRIEILLRDSLEIEKIARLHYGMTKPAEQIYIITSER